MSFIRSVASSSRRVLGCSSTARAISTRPTSQAVPDLRPQSLQSSQLVDMHLSHPNIPNHSASALSDPTANLNQLWDGVVRQTGSDYILGNQYSGRSIEVRDRAGVMEAFRKLQIRLARTGLKADVRRSEFHEKPCDKRRRLASERHRRRFQEMVREKVQIVQTIRNRGS